MVSKGLGFGGWTFIAIALGPSLLFFFFFFVSLASSERVSFGSLPAKGLGFGEGCFMAEDLVFAMGESRWWWPLGGFMDEEGKGLGFCRECVILGVGSGLIRVLFESF